MNLTIHAQTRANRLKRQNLPSEGEGRTFESCRVRQLNGIMWQAPQAICAVQYHIHTRNT